jgi:hypothetical protein
VAFARNDKPARMHKISILVVVLDRDLGDKAACAGYKVVAKNRI